MKKFLLLSASVVIALSAAAELTDATPKAYNFNSGLPIPFVNAYQDSEWGNMPWNPSAFFYTNHPELYKDGLVLMIGPQFQTNYDGILKGINVVNLGEEIGNVLVINRPGSGIKQALKDATGYDYDIPDMEAEPGFIIPLWHSDPDNSMGEEGVENNLRIRIVLNVYQPNLNLTEAAFKPYMQTGSNGTYEFLDNNAPREVYSGDFAKLWGEEESENGRIDFDNATSDDLDKYTDDNDNYVWNPNRWMVYEWDVPGMSGDEAPVKIKMELDGAAAQAAIMIKSIQFLLKDSNEEGIPVLTRRKTWQYYEYGEPSASINTVTADAVEALNVTVNGNAVSFAEPAAVYTATGVLVAKGTEVNLSNGFYVAVAGNKTAKFVVK